MYIISLYAGYLIASLLQIDRDKTLNNIFFFCLCIMIIQFSRKNKKHTVYAQFHEWMKDTEGIARI